MAEIDIKVYKGYRIIFKDWLRQFVALKEGTTEGTANTLEELEKGLDKLVKAKFTPIRVIKVGTFGGVLLGKITSLNELDKSCRFKADPPPEDADERTKGRYSPRSHEKVGLYGSSGSDYYEYSDTNIVIADQMVAMHKEEQALLVQISALRKTLTKNINREYFGLKDDRY